jgi:predicted tellurium resistance membrane protein TerC
MENLILSLLGLIALQVVLGIDNVIFLAIVTSKLEAKFKDKARKIGIVISMAMNTILISLAGFLSAMHGEVFSIFGKSFDVHALILIAGGFFLVFKAVKELYQNIEQKHGTPDQKLQQDNLFKIVATMTAIDFIFSIDSTVTAIGMTNVRWIQIVATLTAIMIMFFFFVPLNKLVEKHPSFKILALSFLVMIGFALFVDGMGIEIPKSYVYSMMVFAILMETINIRFDKNKEKDYIYVLYDDSERDMKHVPVKYTENDQESQDWICSKPGFRHRRKVYKS